MQTSQNRQQEMLPETQQFQQPPHEGVGPGLDPQQQDPHFVDDQQRRHEHQAGQRPPRLDPVPLGPLAQGGRVRKGLPFPLFSARSRAGLERSMGAT